MVTILELLSYDLVEVENVCDRTTDWNLKNEVLLCLGTDFM